MTTYTTIKGDEDVISWITAQCANFSNSYRSRPTKYHITAGLNQFEHMKYHRKSSRLSTGDILIEIYDLHIVVTPSWGFDLNYIEITLE